MKYSIFINQKFLSEVTPQISFDEAAVFDFIKELCRSENKSIESRRIDGYTWVNYKYLLEEMPLLSGRTKKTVGDKIKKLEKYGLIETKLESDGYQKNKYVKLTNMIRFIDPDERKGINEYFLNLLIQNGSNESQARIMAGDAEFIKDRGDTIKRLIEWKMEEDYGDNPAVFWTCYAGYREIENPKKNTDRDIFNNLLPINNPFPPGKEFNK